MTDQPSIPVQPGDALPFCYGMAADRRFYSSESQAGRPAVMVLIGHAAGLAADATIAALLCRADAFAERNADLVILGEEDMVRARRRDALSPARLVDCGGEFLKSCGVSPCETVVLAVDRNRRVALRLSSCGDTDVAAACLACLDRLPREDARDIVLPAPVLILPNLLSSLQCRHLIDLFESRPSMEGEIATIDRDGMPASRVDRDKKRRRDVPIGPDDPLHPLLCETLLRRCVPEIARAFQSKIVHIDRLLLARYDESGGWFRRHRDNVGAQVAFREFAISVNLNTEEYEGGHLLFPEYNDHRYRPPTGGGVIFSASLLHEAAPVTRGRRYVLLTFFYSDVAEQRVACAQKSILPPVAGEGWVEGVTGRRLQGGS